MTFRNLMILASVLSLAYGIAFIFAPSVVSSLFAVDFSPPVKMAQQFFGSGLVGVGLLCWAARDLVEPQQQRKLLLAHGVADLVGLGVALTATLEGSINALGWSSVALYAGLAACCGYLVTKASARYQPA